MTDENKTPAPGRGSGPLPRRPLDEAAGWIARLEAGDLTDEERADFEAWQGADRANADAYRKVAALWDSGELAAAARRQADPVPAIPRRRRFARMARVAAAALVVVAVGLSQIDEIVLALEADYRTATGERKRVDLPDGSGMVLNSGAAVDVAYEDGRRHIRLLAGEAYFEVARDPDRPFEVQGGAASTRALGTAFAVQAGENETTVTVRHGRVAVAGAARPGEPSMLAAAERVRVTNGVAGATTSVNPDMALAWLEGRLIFRDRPLGEVVTELGRYHSGWIVIADDRLRAHTVSGNYRLDDPVAVAAALAATASADLIRVTDFLTILR